MRHPLCLVGLHRWTLQQILSDRLASILFGAELKGQGTRWQEVCARKGCKATRPVEPTKK